MLGLFGLMAISAIMERYYASKIEEDMLQEYGLAGYVLNPLARPGQTMYSEYYIKDEQKPSAITNSDA